MTSDVNIQVWVKQEEYQKLALLRTTKRSWKEFLIDPILDKNDAKKL